MSNPIPALSYLRRKHGMTQRELADAVGVSSQSVSNWESGRNSPPINTLVDVAEALGVTVDDLTREPPRVR